MKCLNRDCLFDTDDFEAKAAFSDKLQLLGLHVQAEHNPAPTQPAPASQPTTQRRKPEKFPRPTVGVDETRERWDNFVLNWTQYKEDSDLRAKEISRQLVACCSDELQTILSRNLGSQQFETEEKVLLEHMKQLAVEYQNPAVYVQEFLDISQQPDEGIRHFLSRLKGVALHCDFSVDCVCEKKVSYADHLTKFKLVSGLVDTEIKEDILGGEDKSLENTVKAVEAKESAKRAKIKLGGRQGEVARVETKKCFRCGGTDHAFTREGLEKCPAKDKTCSKCGKIGHYKGTEKCSRPRYPKKQKSPRRSAEASEVEHVENKSVSAGETAGLFQVMTAVVGQGKANTRVKVPHMLYEQLQWLKRSPPAHPTLNMETSVSTTGYEAVGTKPPPATRRRTTTLRSLADTGCQACCMGPAQLHALGLNSKHLLAPELNLRAANATGITILGAAFIFISGISKQGKRWGTHQLVYVAEGLDQLILSREACESLGIIEKDFPAIGSYAGADINDLSASEDLPEEVLQIEEDLLTPCMPKPDGSCSCPRRETPPPPPACPPGLSAAQLKKIIVNHYAASTFNRCTRQPLPQMQGEPMPIITNPDVKPVAVHRPVPVPLHWQEKVKADLDRDVALGIIEPVPLNTPTSWCSRMVIVPKSNGEPRRTVDFKALNEASVRQTHHTKSPFMLASEVPRGTVKSRS